MKIKCLSSDVAMFPVKLAAVLTGGVVWSSGQHLPMWPLIKWSMAAPPDTSSPRVFCRAPVDACQRRSCRRGRLFLRSIRVGAAGRTKDQKPPQWTMDDSLCIALGSTNKNYPTNILCAPKYIQPYPELVQKFNSFQQWNDNQWTWGFDEDEGSLCARVENIFMDLNQWCS